MLQEIKSTIKVYHFHIKIILRAQKRMIKETEKNCWKNMQMDSLFYETTHINALDIVS
jgi:hypothetical protein